MDAFHLGPLVIPMQLALLLTSILLAQAVAAWYRAARGLDPGDILWKMLVAGFGAARLTFVLRHYQLYFSDPLSIIDVRDGGFYGPAGFAAALVLGIVLARRSKALRAPLAVASLAGSTLFLGGGLLNQALSPAQPPLPTLALRALDGSTVELSQYAGRPVIINLWATWCPPCRREMPALNAARQAHPELAFVFVNQGESLETVRRYLTAQGLRMPNVLIDPAAQFSRRTGTSGYPTTLFYDARGRLYQRHMGELSRASLEEKIEGLPVVVTHATSATITPSAPPAPGRNSVQ